MKKDFSFKSSSVSVQVRRNTSSGTIVLVSLPVFVHSLSLLMYSVNWSKYVKPHAHFVHRRNVNMSKLSRLFKKEIKQLKFEI